MIIVNIFFWYREENKKDKEVKLPQTVLTKDL